MAYDNTNRGTLGKNERKETDKHPDLSGKLNVNGVEYWLSGWNKKSDRGDFISLQIKPKDAKPITPHSEAKGNAYVADKSLQADDDFLQDKDIPF